VRLKQQTTNNSSKQQFIENRPTVLLPHSSMNDHHWERPLRRDLPRQRTQRTGFVAARRSWVAPGLRRYYCCCCCIFDHCILLIICQITSTYLVPFVVPVCRRRSAYYKWDCQWCCCCILDHCILLILCQITSTTWCHLWCLFADGGQRIISRIDFYCHCLVAIV
jgi:hypothetical protein